MAHNKWKLDKLVYKSDFRPSSNKHRVGYIPTLIRMNIMGLGARELLSNILHSIKRLGSEHQVRSPCMEIARIEFHVTASSKSPSSSSIKNVEAPTEYRISCVWSMCYNAALYTLSSMLNYLRDLINTLLFCNNIWASSITTRLAYQSLLIW